METVNRYQHTSLQILVTVQFFILSMLPWQHVYIFSTKLYVKVFPNRFQEKSQYLNEAYITVKLMVKTLGKS